MAKGGGGGGRGGRGGGGSISKYPVQTPKSGQWVLRVKPSEILRETEKAYGLNLLGNKTNLTWLPKSVIVARAKKTSPTHTGGLIVQTWYGKKNARSGGPFYQVK